MNKIANIIEKSDSQLLIDLGTETRYVWYRKIGSCDATTLPRALHRTRL